MVIVATSIIFCSFSNIYCVLCANLNFVLVLYLLKFAFLTSVTFEPIISLVY